ncbi:MAG: flagellar type III secretion system protein FlhB, partial [Mariprofundaceae bacterium]
LFSSKSMAEFVKSVLKLALIGAVAGMVVAGMVPHLLAAAFQSPREIAALAGLGGGRIALFTALVFAFIAVADVLWQRFEHAKSLRMSKKEIRDEHKESEGDPQLKAKIRQIQMQMAQNRMMADVPKADVVITNPTHLAVALGWKPGSPGAPRVLAKGRGKIAARIREIAREAGVPIRENKPLARSLFTQVEIGHEIPEELYEAVAIVLAEIFRLQQRRQGAP